MTAEIIELDAWRSKECGNGAREAFVDIYYAECAPIVGTTEAEYLADSMLKLLWERGFKVVPLDGSE